MRIGLLVMGCGRGSYLARCLGSLEPYLDQFAVKVLVDDSGNAGYVDGITAALPPGWLVVGHDQQQGLAASVNTGWGILDDHDLDFIFHVEEDFVFHAEPPLDDMAFILDETPDLAQLVLQRPPWSAEEIRAGNTLKLYADEITQHDGWCEWRKWFSLNPCLYPWWVTGIGWPEHGGEDEFTPLVLERGYRLGVYGTPDDVPICEHIGRESVLFGGGGFT